jgi:hypothetical protein
MAAKFIVVVVGPTPSLWPKLLLLMPPSARGGSVPAWDQLVRVDGKRWSSGLVGSVRVQLRRYFR